MAAHLVLLPPGLRSAGMLDGQGSGGLDLQGLHVVDVLQKELPLNVHR
jgi:hypothetical protein